MSRRPGGRVVVRRSIAVFLALVCLVGAQCPAVESRTYDVVLSGGRVMDPESGLDAERDVGIIGDRIAEISERRLRGKVTVDCDGLIVAPGFIDLHAHGQELESNRYQAMDGVTTALEMENKGRLKAGV
jgi:N-acyl-D-glutamate deacylase